MTSLEIAQEAVRALDSKKALDLRLIGIRDISSLADYFVLASATSSTQAKALSEEVEYRLSQKGVEPDHLEGRNANTWILLDYETVIVHIFVGKTRDFYDLERLWKDGEVLPLEALIGAQSSDGNS